MKCTSRRRKRLIHAYMLCLIHSNTRRNFLLVYLPHVRLCRHYYAGFILTNAGSPSAAMSNNLTVLIIINILAIITDCAIGRLDKEIARNFCQLTVFPFSFLDCTRNHAGNGLCLIENTYLHLGMRIFQNVYHAHRKREIFIINTE